MAEPRNMLLLLLTSLLLLLGFLVALLLLLLLLLLLCSVTGTCSVASHGMDTSTVPGGITARTVSSTTVVSEGFNEASRMLLSEPSNVKLAICPCRSMYRPLAEASVVSLLDASQGSMVLLSTVGSGSRVASGFLSSLPESTGGYSERIGIEGCVLATLQRSQNVAYSRPAAFQDAAVVNLHILPPWDSPDGK